MLMQITDSLRRENRRCSQQSHTHRIHIKRTLMNVPQDLMHVSGSESLLMRFGHMNVTYYIIFLKRRYPSAI